MSFTKLLHVAVALTISTCFCMSESKRIVLAPMRAPQGFLSIPTPVTSPLMRVVTRNTNTSSKMLSNPLRKMAEDFKNLIEEYTKRRNLAQERGVASQYDKLLEDANSLANEIKDASHKYDELRLEQSKKGSIESGEQADRLTEIMQSHTEPFNSLLWRMDQVIAEIKGENAPISDRPTYEELPPTAKLVPQTSRTQQPEAVSIKETCFDEDEEGKLNPNTLQPLKTKGADLDDIDK